MRLQAIGFLLASASLACGSLLGLPDDPKVLTDLPKPDASAQRDAAPDASVDAAIVSPACQLPNLLTNGGFENGTAAWEVNASVATLENSDIARTGKQSALACAKYTGSEDLSQQFMQATMPTYARVWVRAVPGKPAPQDTGMRVGGGLEQQSGALTEKWVCLETLGMPDDASIRSDITISWGSSAGKACVAVDDAVVYAIPTGGIPDVCKCPQ
jgi:hypothetical protein